MDGVATGQDRATSKVSLVLGIAAVVGLGVAVGTVRRRPRGSKQRAALVTYLHDHLSGADAAIRVVARLRRSQTDERPLFDWLHNQFQAEHLVVQAILVELGASWESPKLLFGPASGAMLKRLAGGKAGDLALFRTLEALAIGVQGKRCMWRALQNVQPALLLPGFPSLSDLETAAVRQWEAIERRRARLVPQTFATTTRSPWE